MAFQVVSQAIQPLSAITAVGQKFTPEKPIRGQSLSILRDAAAFEHFSRAWTGGSSEAPSKPRL